VRDVLLFATLIDSKKLNSIYERKQIMNEVRKDVSLEFTGELFPEVNHMCMIFDNEEQRRKIVAKFLAAGLKRGELIRYIADVATPEEVRSWLLEMGVELPEDESFTVFEAENFYCPSGRFDPRKMIDDMLPRFELVKKAGYSGVRSCGEMNWALKGIPGSDSLLEYEALLSTVVGTFPHIGMCLYDARLFDGATLFKVLKVHPYMIVQGQIVQNPFYIRPEEFLTELRANP